jgi:hypothetical protein
MFKVTPSPPDIDPTSPYESIDSRKLHEAADRALDHYLCPPGSTPPPHHPHAEPAACTPSPPTPKTRHC